MECGEYPHRGTFMAKKKSAKESPVQEALFDIAEEPTISLNDIGIKLDKIIELLQKIQPLRGGY